jgi:hypothetical protein
MLERAARFVATLMLSAFAVAGAALLVLFG